MDLSVVIPTRNRCHLVERAIHSVRSQGAEAVVVDDGSSDRTHEVLSRIRDPELLYLRLPASRGPAMARSQGIRVVRRNLLLFLDDDDVLLPGGGAIICEVARDYPSHLLYLHNCVYSNGRPSIPPRTGKVELSYRDWLGGKASAELKPVARKELFDRFAFEDTGAGGEGLLWGKVVREHGALVSSAPVILYDTSLPDRLTAPPRQLKNATANAHIAARWLEEFGADLRAENERRWEDRLTAAVVWHLLAGDRSAARILVGDIDSPPPRPALKVALWIVTLMPERLLRTLFLARGRLKRRRLTGTIPL